MKWIFYNKLNLFLYRGIGTIIKELLIFGTGKSFVPIPLNVKKYINDLGIQIESVDSVSLHLLNNI